MGQLDGKVALVTGSARGQGRSHALTLAREGADLILVDAAAPIKSVPYELATPEDLAATTSEVEKLDRRALEFQADIRDQAALDDAVSGALAEFGHIDIVVANAGVWSINDFWKLSDEEWDDIIAVNLTGHWRTLRAVAPHLIERGSGSIVMVSSVNGLEAAPGYAHYGAAKSGLLGLMRAVAVELGPHGIRCNAICPGAMDTTMNTWQGALDWMAGKEDATMEDRREGGRHWSILRGKSMLSPSSTSAAVLWLASDATADVTGVALPVDGGHMVTPGFNPAPVAGSDEAPGHGSSQ